MNLILPSFALFILILLMIVFFFKKRLKLDETKLYSYLLIISIFNIIYNLIGIYLGYNNGNIYFLKFLNHLDLPLYFFWASTLLIYLLNIYIGNENSIIYKRIKKGIYCLDFIMLVISWFLPVSIVIEEKYAFANGMAVNFVYGLSGLFLAGCVILSILLLVRKKVKKQVIPIFALLFLGIIVVIIQKLKPEIIIIPSMIVYVELIMFFTIENPDVKMLNEITLAKSELEKANRVKSDFISSMSHEIRTPLNAIVGFSELAKYAETLEEAKENSDDIINASKDLMGLMDRMFEMFAIERENSEIQETEYNPCEIINKVVSLYEKKIKKKNLKLITNVDSKMPIIIGDADLIKKIVLNILDNAYKFTEKGSIIVTAQYIKNSLSISVEDTGIGIKKDELENIFIPFNKSSDTKNTTYSGMGLGLNITKSLIDRLDGDIEIQSDYGKGTKVIIKINQKKVG